MKNTFLFILLCALLSCDETKVESTKTDQITEEAEVLEAEIAETKLEPINKDSLLFERYQDEIQKAFFDEEDALNKEELDSVFWQNNQFFGEMMVTYSPDSMFKIYVIEQIGCGAYCNPDWYSWVHYNLNETERVKTANFENYQNNFTNIESIHQLSDGKYLVIESSYGRPASYATVVCLGAKLISFVADSAYLHQIPYRGEEVFRICQENFVETNGPILEYDSIQKTLNYHYGNGYFIDSMDVDTNRTGVLEYKGGAFQLKEEQIEVVQRPIETYD